MFKKIIVTLVMSVALAFGQTPTPKPQPSAPTYSANELNLFPEYTRDSFESTFGKQAPAYDAKRPMKSWFDSTKVCDSKNSNVTYSTVSSNTSAPALVPLVLSSCDASSVNLKGALHYDTFRVAPMNVILTSTVAGIPNQQVSPNLLSTLNEALVLKAELGSTAEVTEVTSLNSFFSYKKVDPNSPFSVYKLGLENVGMLLQDRNKKGVNYPGTWETTQFGHSFHPDADAPVDGPVNSVVPVPVRDLLPNEKLTFQIMGLIPVPMVARTDMGSSGSPSTGGGFTDADRAMLQQLMQMMSKFFPQ